MMIRALLPVSFLCVTLGGTLTATGTPRPNFIFVLTDDQGWAESAVPMHPGVPHSCSPYLDTPNMARLAKSGMRFTSGYASAPLCTPTRRSVLTGMTPARIRGTEFQTVPPNSFEPAKLLTIPKALKAVDPAYRTAHFGKWGELIPAPEAAGYDASDGRTGNHTGGGLGGWENRQPKIAKEPKEDPKLTFSVTKRAIDFMAQQVREEHPFYLQVSYYAIHSQIQTRAATLKKYRTKGEPPRDYPLELAAMIEDLDTAIGQLLDQVDALGIADNTYFVLSSDNGAEDGALSQARVLPGKDGTSPRPGGRLSPNFPLRGAKQWLYEGGIRVPFIVRGPGVKAGCFSHVPVVQYDLLPTFVDLAGGKGPLSTVIDGGSFRSVIENGGEGEVKRGLPGLVFHRPARGYSAFRSGDMKLVVNWTENRKELYDLAKDIGEQHDLAAEQPKETAALFDILMRYLTAVNAEGFGKNDSINGRRTGALKAN